MKRYSIILTAAALLVMAAGDGANAAKSKATGAASIQLTAEQLRRWGSSEMVFVGMLKKARGGPMGLSMPPMYTHQLTVSVTEVLRGKVKAGALQTCSHVARQHNRRQVRTDQVGRQCVQVGHVLQRHLHIQGIDRLRRHAVGESNPFLLDLPR